MRKIIIGLMAAAGLAAGALTATPAYAETIIYASIFVQEDRCGTRYDEFWLSDSYGLDGGETWQDNYLVKHADGTWSGFAVADPGYTFWTPNGTSDVVERHYAAFDGWPGDPDPDVCAPGERGRPKDYVGEYRAY